MTGFVKPRAGIEWRERLLLDPCDKWILSSYWLCLHLARAIPRVSAMCPKTRKKVHITRLILDCPDGAVIDHINGNTLDNRRANLRICTPQQNNWNMAVKKGARYGYKGVELVDSRYRARIKVGGKVTTIGRFDTAAEAARAYDDAARKNFGEFCAVNFPNEGERDAAVRFFHGGTND